MQWRFVFAYAVLVFFCLAINVYDYFFFNSFEILNIF